MPREHIPLMMGQSHWFHYAAKNGAGELLTLWCKNKFKCERINTNRGIIIEGKWGGYDQPVTINSLNLVKREICGRKY